MHTLPSSWDLPQAIKQRFGLQRAGKQRAMIADDHLLLVLHHPPRSKQRDRKVIFFWRQPDGTWKASTGGRGIQSLIKHIKLYSSEEEALNQQYAEAENAEDYFALLETIAPLRLETQNLHSTLQAAREGIPLDREIVDLRDWAHELERSLNLLYENAKNAMDFTIAQRGEEQAQLSLKAVESGHRLNILAAIFFPLTALASVFGMNLKSGLENSEIATFWSIFFLGGVAGFFVLNWVIRGQWFWEDDP
ncbi:hypothetical protein JJD41_13465 [Oxynema sp. CENA135]|nr:hypothetical protein [Oxynema sp. CENA135]